MYLPIKNGDFPANHVSFPGIFTFTQDTLETFPEGLSAPVTWWLEFFRYWCVC